MDTVSFDYFGLIITSYWCIAIIGKILDVIFINWYIIEVEINTNVIFVNLSVWHPNGECIFNFASLVECFISGVSYSV